MPRRFAAALALVALGMSVPAHAGRYLVEARTEAQAYQLRTWAGRSAGDPDVFPRYRIVQYLDLGAYELADLGPGERIDLVASLRLDHDFGLSRADQEALDDAGQPQGHLLFGYVQWLGAAGGWLDLRAGRQVVLDELEFFAFDGADVHVHTPAHVGVSGFGGWQVRSTSFLGSGTHAPDGVRPTDQRRLDAGLTTDLLNDPPTGVAHYYLDEPSPIFGGRLHLEGVRGVSLMAVYRRSISKTSAENVEDLPQDAQGYQLDTEHAGAGGRWQIVRPLVIYASADRDLVRQRMASIRGGTRVEAIPHRLAFVAEGSRWNPSFDADSIWNLFATGPRDDFELRAEWSPPGPFRVYGGPLLTVYHLALDAERAFPSDPADPASAPLDPERTDLLPGAVAGAATRANQGYRAGLDAVYRGSGGALGDADYLGRELWIDASGGLDLSEDRHALDARVSVAHVSDPYQPGLQRVTSAGVALVGTFRLSRLASLVLIGEDNFNRFTKSDVRGTVVLDVRADLR